MPDTNMHTRPVTHFNWRESVPHLLSIVLMFEKLEGKKPFLSIGHGSANVTVEHANEADGKDWLVTRSKPNGCYTLERFEMWHEAIEAAMKP